MRDLTLILVATLLPAQATQFHGYPRSDSEELGFQLRIVRPKTPAKGRPWVWRARFFGHQPQTERALLARGFHLVYAEVGGLFGNAEALRRFDACYQHVTNELGLHPRPVLLGMSRGGLPVLRWASAHPGQVACVYLDAPVCDIRSWPGGKGRGKGSPVDWRRCLAAHGLSEAQAVAWPGNPIHPDLLRPLAAAQVPILSVCGSADRVVPLAENTAIFAAGYRQLGGPIRVLRKPGVGHHPHSLQDPGPIVSFVLRHTLGSGDHFVLRAGLARSLARFRGTEPARVAFLGGSITFNPGWRDLVAKDLRRRFPDQDFAFINAGVPSFGYTPGAFRLHRDVLSKGRVDLCFVEAAVNDATNGRSPTEMTRGMEGIVRQLRQAQPHCDIILLHFVDPHKMRQLDRGIVPTVIQRHEAVAAHYRLPSINLAEEVSARIEAGEFSWKEDFKNLHPSPFGQRLYAASIRRLFDTAWAKQPKATPRPTLPPALDPHSYIRGRMLPPAQARGLRGFTLTPRWRPRDKAGSRRGFVDVPVLVGDQTGAQLRLPFMGRSIGILVNAGPDAGQLEFSIDGEPWQRRELFTRWSRRLHLPWSHVLATGLSPGAHQLRLRIAGSKHPRSVGHAARVVWFLVDAH